MSNVTIFKSGTEVAVSERELSSLAKSLASSSTSRRIQANNNGTFKRLVNGETIGDPIRGELNIIIVNALPRVSRIFYAGEYDPDGEPTLPNCWSNLGDIPEEAAEDKQHANCAECPQNIKGSGQLGGRACRFQRRLAILVENDPSGNLYQFNIPAKSLFGKGQGNVHPFESYVRFLIHNGQSPDTVVTTVGFNDDADTLELLFTPHRELNDEEYEQVQTAQAHPDAERYIKLTVAQSDGVQKPAVTTKTVTVVEEIEEEKEEEVVKEPVKKKTSKKKVSKKEATDTQEKLADVVSKWADEDNA